MKPFIEVMMNYLQAIHNECQRLPENLQKEVLDFIYFLESRYPIKVAKFSEGESLSDAEVEQACGILKAPHGGGSLEDIETAIKQRGGKL